jgi:hypothetical protein
MKLPLQRALRQAGISGEQGRIGWHDLRHPHGSNLAMRGVPLEVICRDWCYELLWQTGTCSDITIARRPSSARATSPEVIKLIGTLAKERSDREVAAELNRRGLLSGVKRAWDKEAVRWVRKRYGIRRQPAGRRGRPREPRVWAGHHARPVGQSLPKRLGRWPGAEDGQVALALMLIEFIRARRLQFVRPPTSADEFHLDAAIAWGPLLPLEGLARQGPGKDEFPRGRGIPEQTAGERFQHAAVR